MFGNRFRFVAIVTAVWMAVAASAFAQTHQALPDNEILHLVTHELSKDEAFTAVKVTVTDQMVTLDGTVPSLWAKNEAIDRVRKVEDVLSVVSNLSIASAESDGVVRDEIARKIQRYVFYTIFDNVDLRVENGVVTLYGQVVMPYRATEIGRLAARVPGVKEVNNEIEVLPASIYDDEIRTSLAIQIYEHPLFSNYAIQTQPPIHIVVKNGHVTLTGVVNSEVQRTLAEHIARGVPNVFSVTNKLRLDRELS